MLQNSIALAGMFTMNAKAGKIESTSVTEIYEFITFMF